MEDFSQFLIGNQSKANPQANSVVSQDGKKLVNSWSEQEIDRLINTESSKNPYAINKETNAMGVGQFTPSTLAMLHKQGIKFDPFDPEQSRGAIRTYLDKLTEQTGSKEGALKAYGGFVTKDPNAYISKILVKNEPTSQSVQQSATDDFQNFLIGKTEKQPAQKLASVSQQDIEKATQINEPKKGFLGEFVEPLKTISEEDWKKKSMLPKVGIGLAGNLAEKKQLVEDIYQGSENLVKGIQEFSKHPFESTKAVAKEIYEHPGKFVGESIKGLIYDPETLLLPGVSSAAKTVGGVAKEAVGGAIKQSSTAAEQMAAQLTAKKAPQMAGVGAAETTTKSMLDQAAATASPELKPALEKLKNTNPANIDTDVLNRHIEADSLPIPVRLTEGQATQNPVLISRERNERGLKEQLAQHLNSQNKALQENANLMKERVAPDVFTPNHVADAESAIKNVELKAKATEDTITQAYKDLEDLGAGKIQVDSKAFGNNAISKLAEKDDIDFLPSAIDRKIREYASGKPMNFNQYENLRTQIARETRKAQSAQDGNAVHALTLVRGELEKLPLIGETAEAKQVADVARNLAKQEFDLLDKNKPSYNSVYANVVNGAADTKDFIPKTILRSDNKDFAKAMELFKDDPITMQHLASGTLDWIIRDSTDASGNFLTSKFSKHINNLDLNGKLTPLFGEEAQTLKNIAKTGQYIEARPKGSFVNESNTLVGGLAQMGKQYAIKSATKLPVVGRFVEPAVEISQARTAAKEVKKSLKPGAGIEQKPKKTKLSDIGK